MMDIRISLIIPCWNVEEYYIRRAIESVDAQTFSGYEVIIVDDGSKEKYHKVLNDIVAQHSNYRLITLENGGVSRARNIGAANARGKYIAYLDADDKLDENYLSEAYHIAEKEKADFIIGATYENGEVDLCGKFAQPQYAVYEESRIEEIKKHFIGWKNLIRIPHGRVGRGPVARLVKIDIMRKVQFPENISIGEDVIWNLKILSVCKKVVIVKQCWYFYLPNPHSATQGYNPQVYEMWMRLFRELDSINDCIDIHEKFFIEYMEYIFEGIDRIYECFIKYKSPGYQKIVHKIYTEEPWTYFGSTKALHLCRDPKFKIYMYLYRKHILFKIFPLKKILGKIRDDFLHVRRKK